MEQNEVVTGQTTPPVAAETTVEPVVTETPAPDTAGAEQPKSTAPTPDPEAKKALRGVQRRIDELTRAKNDAIEAGKREAEEWRQRAIAAAQQAEELRKQIPGPKWEEYGDIEKYTAAMAEHKAKEMLRVELGRLAQANQEQQQRNAQVYEQQQRMQQFQAVVSEKVQEATKRYPDFIDVVTSPELPGMQGTAAFNAVLDSEKGAEIMYYLGKNPVKAHQIVNLSPVAQVREIGRIEAQIESGSVVSKAPPPPDTVGGGTGGAPKDPSQMSYEEFVKYRRRQIAQRR